jgi:structural maintenance of chromosome 1
MAQLQELSRSKPRGKADDNIIAEITRLESAMTVTKDDLVRILIFNRGRKLMMM